MISIVKYLFEILDTPESQNKFRERLDSSTNSRSEFALKSNASPSKFKEILARNDRGSQLLALKNARQRGTDSIGRPPELIKKEIDYSKFKQYHGGRTPLFSYKGKLKGI